MNTQALEWKESGLQDFWSREARNQHVIQLYENEHAFHNALEGFAGTGLLTGESVIVVAEEKHLTELHRRLEKQHFNLQKLIIEDRYFPLDAEDLMDNFIVNGNPDPQKFRKLADGIVRRAKKDGRQVRIFGEIVALLWNEGNRVAAENLENLWNKFILTEKLTLFCAYPKVGLSDTALQHVCALHTKRIGGFSGPTTMISYKEL